MRAQQIQKEKEDAMSRRRHGPRQAIFVTTCVLAANLSGCLTVGEEFPTNVTWIQVGTTTRAQIRQTIGEPFRTGYDSGQLTYTYGFYRYSVFRPTRTKDLTVRFAADGKVASYSFASSFDEDKAAIEKTPK
jgi:outer membrane protein assembly factor BamE (lipoprotein component of BamABCDE complex)